MEADLSRQRDLKKHLDQEARDKVEQKKLQAEAKKKEAADLKIAKVEAKLAKLKSEAADRESRKVKKPVKPVKRKLDKELEAEAGHDDLTKSEPLVPSHPGPSTPSKVQKEGLKLTPKAKRFASKTTPNSKARQRVDARATRAASNLERLRGIKLDGMTIPPAPFSKKILA